MLKKTLYAALGGAAVLIAVWAGSLRLSCEPPKPSGEAHEDASKAKKNCSTVAGALFTYTGHFIHEYRDDITATSTAIIAIFTVVLGIFTVRLAGSTRIAANAAKLSADAVVRVELPYLALIRAGLIANGQVVSPGTPLPQTSKPNITFINWGRSHAEVTHGCIEWAVTNKLPMTPEYKNIIAYAPGIVTIKDANVPLDVPCQIILSPAQIVAIDTTKEWLWVFGFIRFKDFLGDPHDVRFCMKWAPHPERDGGPLASFGILTHPQNIHVVLRTTAPACRSHLSR